MRARLAALLGWVLLSVPVAAYAEETAPCLRLRATVVCDLGDEVTELVYEGDCAPPATSPDECCRWFGEAARLRCALTLGGNVQSTECRCLRFTPAVSVWVSRCTHCPNWPPRPPFSEAEDRRPPPDVEPARRGTVFHNPGAIVTAPWALCR